MPYNHVTLCRDLRTWFAVSRPPTADRWWFPALFMAFPKSWANELHSPRTPSFLINHLRNSPKLLRRLLGNFIDHLTSPDPRSRLIAVIPQPLTHNSRTLSHHNQVRISNMGILGQVLYFAVHPNQLRSIIQWLVSSRKR